jgi:aryl sulfotransferase
MPGEIRKIAGFLETPVDEEKWQSILLHCSFDYMKANATKSVPLGGAFWDGGAQTFIHKGINGRWRDILEKDESLKYEVRAVEELGEECARWLATGEMS